MKLLFERWRKHLTHLQERLLAEGRAEDAKKKYPHLDTIIDYYVERDPSGNNKYLNWLAKQTDGIYKAYGPSARRPFGLPNEDIVLAMMDGHVPSLANLVEKFHKHNQRMPKFGYSKDIGSYSEWGDLHNAVREVEQQETQAAKRAEEKKAAQESSDVIDNTDDYFIVRPYTLEASCYYGQRAAGTQVKWCVTQAEASYFDEYTSEGQMFYFVFLKNVDPSNRYKKMAFVFDSENDLASVWDAPNSTLDQEEQTEAFIQNILHQGEDEGAWMTYLWNENDGYVDEPTEKDEQSYIEALQRLGIDWDPVPDSARSKQDEFKWRNEQIRKMAEQTLQDVVEKMTQHSYDAPAGPTWEDFEKIKEAFDTATDHATIRYDSYEPGKWDFDAWMTFDFSDLEWKDDTADNDPMLEEIVRFTAEDNSVYYDDVTVEWNVVTLSFVPDPYDDYYGYYGSRKKTDLEKFEEFANEIIDKDSRWQEVWNDTIDRLKEERMIPAPDLEREREYWPNPEEKKQQLELPLTERKIRVRLKRR